MRKATAPVAALALSAAFAVACAGRPPRSVAHWDEDLLSPQRYRVRIEKDVQVPMRDGVTLATDLYIPEAPGRFPALLWRNCYGKDGYGDMSWYASRGYVVVHQDVRGKHASGGDFVHFRDDANDGFDTDEWIGAQPWSNGKIGLMGGSYLGYTGIAQAVRGSRHLAAMSISVATGDVYNGWIYSDGALFLGFAFPWGAVGMNGREFRFQNPVPVPWPEIFAHLPLETMDVKAGYPNPVYREWLRHPRAGDPYWKDVSYEKDIARISIPVLVLEGWYDLFLRGALQDHVLITRDSLSARARRHKHLVIGPWAHEGGVRNNAPKAPAAGPDRSLDFGPEAAVETRKIYLRWQDHWLKGIDNGIDREPPVRIFVMGENTWRFENEWPLARTRYTKYYFGGTRANSINGDGTLATAAPAAEQAADSYVYDPASPVPTLGGNTCCSQVPSGPWNQIEAEMRDDVLVYSTPELKTPLEVTGPVKVTLYASSSARDTDWTAKLVDVHPDGYAQNLCDGIIRARYRAGRTAPADLLEPGRIYEYEIDLWATSNVFLPGHRIRVEISSSNFPRFDRNLNTGEDPMTGTRMAKAEQTIYRSKQRPSHIVLPIIPRRR